MVVLVFAVYDVERRSSFAALVIAAVEGRQHRVQKFSIVRFEGLARVESDNPASIHTPFHTSMLRLAIFPGGRLSPSKP